MSNNQCEEAVEQSVGNALLVLDTVAERYMRQNPEGADRLHERLMNLLETVDQYRNPF